MVSTVSCWEERNVSFGDGYPGWKSIRHPEILQICGGSYKRLFAAGAKD